MTDHARKQTNVTPLPIPGQHGSLLSQVLDTWFANDPADDNVPVRTESKMGQGGKGKEREKKKKRQKVYVKHPQLLHKYLFVVQKCKYPIFTTDI